jgi:hypothetical protein
MPTRVRSHAKINLGLSIGAPRNLIPPQIGFGSDWSFEEFTDPLGSNNLNLVNEP